MTDQLDLIDHISLVNARRNDPDTAIEASNLHPRLRQSDRRQALLLHAVHPDGMTDFELATLMHRQQTSAGKRRGELRDLGLIEQTDERRPAPSGAASIVWKITAEGRRVAREITE